MHWVLIEWRGGFTSYISSSIQIFCMLRRCSNCSVFVRSFAGKRLKSRVKMCDGFRATLCQGIWSMLYLNNYQSRKKLWNVGNQVNNRTSEWGRPPSLPRSFDPDLCARSEKACSSRPGAEKRKGGKTGSVHQDVIDKRAEKVNTERTINTTNNKHNPSMCLFGLKN